MKSGAAPRPDDFHFTSRRPPVRAVPGRLPQPIPHLEDDDLYTPIGASYMEEKYRLVWTYDQIFSTGMKNKWDERVYIDLFCGPGRVSFKETGLIYPGSPILALKVRDPFTRYIFCDLKQENIETLRRRVEAEGDYPVEYLCGDANDLVNEVLNRIPRHGRRKVLAFTFLDPRKIAQLPFATVETLARNKIMDFLILLPTGMDILRRPIEWKDEEESQAIARWTGNTNWRKLWIHDREPNENDRQFLTLLYGRSMERLKYLPTKLERVHSVLHPTKRYPLYHLAFFSQHERGLEFWDHALDYHRRATDQFTLF